MRVLFIIVFFLTNNSMNTKTILIGVLIIGGLIGLMWWGRNNQTATPAAAGTSTSNTESALIASEMQYDFGTISMAKGNVEKVFTVTNPTGKDILLSRLVTSCMCTTAYIVGPTGQKGPFGMPGHGGSVPPANEIIEAGTSVGIKVVYDPNAHGPAGVGTIDRAITLTDSEGAVLELTIRATVTP